MESLDVIEIESLQSSTEYVEDKIELITNNIYNNKKNLFVFFNETINISCTQELAYEEPKFSVNQSINQSIKLYYRAKQG